MSLEAERQSKGEVSQSFLVWTILEHIVDIVFGKYTPSSITHPYKTAIAYFGEVVIVINLLLAVLLANLFYPAVKENPRNRSENKVSPVATHIFMRPDIKRQGNAQIA